MINVILDVTPLQLYQWAATGSEAENNQKESMEARSRDTGDPEGGQPVIFNNQPRSAQASKMIQINP